jgi:Lon-like protease
MSIVGPTLLVLIVLAFIGALVIPLPYVSFSPGTALDVNGRIEIAKGPDDETPDQVMLATVGLRRKLVPIELLIGWLKDDVDIEAERDVFGDESPTESETRSREEMDDAKVTAQLVALRRLGEEPTGGSTRIELVEKDFPAAKVLNVGDLILRVEGRPICLQGDVRTAIRTKREGETVRITIERDGRRSDVDAPVRWVEEYQRAFLGIQLSREKACALPIDVTIDTKISGQEIGGPSAGLAMTLAVLDRLTPGDLTGGRKIATTGTMEADGSVGEVGGVKQKTFAVRRAGATMFIVPDSEVALAKPYAGDMEVVGVSTLDEALAALERAGGDPLPDRLS